MCQPLPLAGKEEGKRDQAHTGRKQDVALADHARTIAERDGRGNERGRRR